MQLKDVSEETSLFNLLGDVSEICKSALFEMSLRRCMRRLRDASMPAGCDALKKFLKFDFNFTVLKRISITTYWAQFDQHFLLPSRKACPIKVALLHLNRKRNVMKCCLRGKLCCHSYCQFKIIFL